MIIATATATASTGLWGPTLVAALIAGAIGLVTLAVNQQRARKDRQRELFADAFAAVTEYREYPFIVRRRGESGDDRQTITHDLSGVQAKLNQYVARLRIEAPRVGRAYAHVVIETKRIAGAEIRRSWDTAAIGEGPMHVRDIDLSELDAVDADFIEAAIDHLAVSRGVLRRLLQSSWLRLRGPRPPTAAEPSRTVAAEVRQ
jgi:hypothetical protein